MLPVLDLAPAVVHALLWPSRLALLFRTLQPLLHGLQVAHERGVGRKADVEGAKAAQAPSAVSMSNGPLPIWSWSCVSRRRVRANASSDACFSTFVIRDSSFARS